MASILADEGDGTMHFRPLFASFSGKKNKKLKDNV
jgi:hypothetical protein